MKHSLHYKLLISLSLFILNSLIASAQAFDLDNTGEFAIVHRNGQVTDLTLKISKQHQQWKVQNRDENGTWQDIGCQGDCQLVESKKDEVAYFMGAKEPEDMSTQCIHNVAFALCRVDVDGDKLPHFLFIALTVAPPTAVDLYRLPAQNQSTSLR